MSVRVTNIQRMCCDDGPGIRTTVFLKGCSIHCPWCSNPENISYEKQPICDRENPQTYTGREYGMDYEPQKLVSVLEKDRKFWGCDGGVTFSGGEALLQAVQLEEVWVQLKRDGIHLALETALFIPEPLLEIAMQYIDFYYVDVKLLDEDLCASVLGGNIGQYRQNVERLVSQQKNIHFRVPCSKEYVLQESNQAALCDFFRQYRQYPVEIFSIHDLGREKYRTLGMEMPRFENVTDVELEAFQRRLSKEGCQVKIISI